MIKYNVFGVKCLLKDVVNIVFPFFFDKSNKCSYFSILAPHPLPPLSINIIVASLLAQDNFRTN